MKVKLESFRYLPREPQNWGTRSLHFGDMITVVQGANGSGKTPIMKGIMQGLGHEVELPPAIEANCSAAELTSTVCVCDANARVRSTRRLCRADSSTVVAGEG